MNEYLASQTGIDIKPMLSISKANMVLQRACACGKHSGSGGECEECKKKREGALLQRAAVDASPVNEVPSIVHEVLRSPGQPLDAQTRAFMEPRFGHDFSGVRVHTDAKAAESARAVNALAYTVGRDVVFGQGQFKPETQSGYQLIAHELAHVKQQMHVGMGQWNTLQMGSPDDLYETEAGQAIAYPRGVVSSVSPGTIQCERTYTTNERRAMVTGTVQGQRNDSEIASRYDFENGDIVFRLGSAQLARLIDNPVTHGGIYLGGGIIHDMVGFGNRNVRVSDFYDEAADPSVVKVVRFTGPQRDLIIQRVLDNIRRRDFRIPTDPIPWNLFSSSDDYRTATCLEYAHAQILYAIQQLSYSTSIPPSSRQELISTYLRSGSAEPDPLIHPQSIQDVHLVGTLRQMPFLRHAASIMADSSGNVDPTVFANREETTEEIRQIERPNLGPVRNFIRDLIVPPTLIQTETLRTYTYRSFAESRRYFTVIR